MYSNTTRIDSRHRHLADALVTRLEQAAYEGYEEVAAKRSTNKQCKNLLRSFECDASTIVEPTTCGHNRKTRLCRIDFSQYNRGDWVSGNVGCSAILTTSPWIPKGQAGHGNYGPDGKSAMIFDSSRPSGNDWDLGTPNNKCGGPGRGSSGEPGSDYENCEPQGNLLIISEDGHQWDPDDNNGGGIFSFEFPVSLKVLGIGVVDVMEHHHNSDIVIHRDGRDPLVMKPPPTGENGFALFKLGHKRVNKLEVVLKREAGAVSYIDVMLPKC